MPDEGRHESAGLQDYEVLDASNTLDGAPSDDPLDRGVVIPGRWSAAIRFGTTAAEQYAGESLDQVLGEEEPDIALDDGDDLEDIGPDENATDDDVRRYLLDDSRDPRAGRLVVEDDEVYEEGGSYLAAHDESVAHDAGIDGGGATAEEAAVHIVDDDTDLHPDD